MPPKANNFSFELTCLVCSETFRNQADIKNHGCRKLSIKCRCCLNTFTVRNKLAEHLNQKGIYQREPMVPPSSTDLSEQDTVTDTLDTLEQILQSVNIPIVHTMAEIPQQQIPLVVAESSLEDPVDVADPEVVEILSIPLIENVDESQTSDTPTNSQSTASSVTEQNTVSVRPPPAVSRGKDIQNLREQYSRLSRSQALKVHAFICQSLTFCSATQPFIWCSRFPRRCT